MNKKEIAEIKKQFTPANCSITRIRGCYVDGEKNKKTEIKEAFLSLSEEEMFKYFDIFRKTLSGTLGKNLINMEFPLSQEGEGGTQHFLMKLRESKLQDDDIAEAFFDKVIEHYDYAENYYIILIHAVYDIPGKSTDVQEMFDASDEVYDYLLCTVCPVKLTKPGLCYNAERGAIENRIRDWLVEAPATGFLFPAFNDRSTDIHSLLFYSKDADLFQARLIEDVLRCTLPLPVTGQKETFNTLVEETLGEDCDFDTVRAIHERLAERLEETKDAAEPLTLSAPDMKRLLYESGADEERLSGFDDRYEEAAGKHTALLAANVTSTRKFEVRTPDVIIQVSPDKAALLETRIIDGRQCLVIPMDEHVEVNGICVHPKAE